MVDLNLTQCLSSHVPVLSQALEIACNSIRDFQGVRARTDFSDPLSILRMVLFFASAIYMGWYIGRLDPDDDYPFPFDHIPMLARLVPYVLSICLLMIIAVSHSLIIMLVFGPLVLAYVAGRIALRLKKRNAGRRQT